MRTIPCHACKAEIPADAIECPACGVEAEAPTKTVPSVRPADVPSPRETPTARPSSRKMPVAKPIEPVGEDDE